MSTENIKEEARRLLERLPDTVTWDELMHEIYVRQTIEAGLSDSRDGKPWTSKRCVNDLDYHRESCMD